MTNAKDQFLLENIYNSIRNTPTEEKSNDNRAENLLSDALIRNGVDADPSSEKYRDALDQLIAVIQHSPEDEQEEADKLALSFIQGDNIPNEEVEETIPFDFPMEKSILGAYKKVIQEAKKVNKNNK